MTDPIDRQAMIDAINQSKFTYKVSPEFVDNRTDEEKRSSLFQLIKCTMVQVVEAMPSAEPKKGKWLKISPAGIYECSECHQNVMTRDISVYRFCHHCGAGMIGKGE